MSLGNLTYIEGAAYWVDDKDFLVTAHTKYSKDSWTIYCEGLRGYYASIGVQKLATREYLDIENSTIFWLIHSCDKRVIGGFRWTNPIFDKQELLKLPCYNDIHSSESFGNIKQFLLSKIAGGIVEVKGFWKSANMNGLSSVVSKSFWHALVILQVETVVATTANPLLKSQLSKWSIETLPNTAPAAFPTPNFQTSFLFARKENEESLNSNMRSHIFTEQAYLSQFFPTVLASTNNLNQRAKFHIGSISSNKPISADSAEHRNFRRQLEDAYRCGFASILDSMHEYSHPWVHFPWRKSTIRVLSPKIFRLVRQNRNMLKLTLQEMEALSSKRVGVIGMSVGSSIAFCIAQEGLCGRELRIADFDSLDLSNLNRLSASIVDIGTSKTTIMMRRLSELDPFLRVTLFENGVQNSFDEVDQFLRGLDVVVEECDSLDVKLMVRMRARKMGIPVVMETSNNGMLDVERYDEDRNYPLLHGLLEGLDPAHLRQMSVDERITIVRQILGESTISQRMKISLEEMKKSIQSWPQLAEEISLGTALATAAVRRILLGLYTPSGRICMGLDEMLLKLSKL